MVWFHRVMRNMPLTASAPPGQGEEDEGGQQGRVEKPKTTMATAPHRGREHHRQAVPVHARRPARGEAGHERPHRGRGVEEAEHPRSAQALGERGEQRERHAEDHGHEVHDVGADQLLAAARVAEALAAPQARLLGSPGAGRSAWPRSRQGEQVGERPPRRPPPLRRRPRARRRGRARDHAHAAAERRPARPRPASRPWSTSRGVSASRDGRCRPLRADMRPPPRRGAATEGCVERRVQHQQRAARHEADLREDHHAAPVHGVGEGAAHEGGDEQRQQLGQAEQAHGQARAGEPVHLPGQGDVGDHAAQEGDELRGEEQPDSRGGAKGRRSMAGGLQAARRRTSARSSSRRMARGRLGPEGRPWPGSTQRELEVEEPLERAELLVPGVPVEAAGRREHRRAPRSTTGGRR